MDIATNMDFDFTSLLCGDDTQLEFNVNDFDLSMDMTEQKTRYIKPKFNTKAKSVSYASAAELAKQIKLAPGEQIHAIVAGNFVFGDFVEALLVEKQATANRMHLSTLSLSQNNIDSLEGLIDGGYVKKLDIVVSNYFYSHEKHRLVPYLFDKLDKDDILDMMVCRSHTKICLLEISNIKIVMTGSANLRSSNCIEQFILQESPELYDFYFNWLEECRQYSIIDKGVEK